MSIENSSGAMRHSYAAHSYAALLGLLALLALPALFALMARAAPAGAGPLQVVATLPDLGNLAEIVGGDEVEVAVLAGGPQDPHFVEARPSFIRSLHSADLFLVNGLDLEIGWVPALLRGARNRAVQPGASGHLDASAVIEALDVPTGGVDRSQGDVHPSGNPHYLTDPINGLRVAALIRDRLAELRPGSTAGFRERHQGFTRALVAALVGEDLASAHEPEALAARVAAGDLDEFLEKRNESARLGGWLGALRPHRGTRAVQDHLLWPYFAHRFGLRLADTLESRPGIAPTTRHLTDVIARMRAEGVRVVLSSPYIDPRHANFVAERTGARVVEMAHQVGARPGTADYLALVDHNVRRLLEAL